MRGNEETLREKHHFEYLKKIIQALSYKADGGSDQAGIRLWFGLGVPKSGTTRHGCALTAAV